MNLIHGFKRIGKLTIASVLAAGVLYTVSGTGAQASSWQIYDKGEHVLLPEGPIEQNGVIMVPLRPIAERFGYTLEQADKGKVILRGGIGEVTLKQGSTSVTFNGSLTRQVKKAPEFINGSLFVSMDMVGYITDIGYEIIPGTELIQLRPVTGDAKLKLDEQYLHAFSVPGGTQYVNNKGEIILNATYSYGSDFGYEELTPVLQLNQGVGYIDRSGKLAIKAPHYRLSSFSEGLASFKDLVQVKGAGQQVKYGYLNRSGTVVIPAMYDRAYGFSDGLAKVVKDDKTFYIDHNGRTAIPAIPNSTHTEPFSEGLAPVSVLTNVGGKALEKTGYINTSGKFVIQPQFDYGSLFSDGLAIVYQGNKSGYIDKTGKLVIKPQFPNGYARDFHNGVANVIIRGEHPIQMGLIDKSGNKLALPSIENVDTYSEGLFPFEQNSLWGYMDLKGKVVIKPQFTSAYSFLSGAARVNLYSADPNVYIYALIDKTGAVIWQSK